MVNHRRHPTLVFLLWITCFHSITTSAFQNFHSNSIDHVSTKYNDLPRPFSTLSTRVTFRPLLQSPTFNTYAAKPARPNKSFVTFMTLKEPESDTAEEENPVFPGITDEQPEEKLRTTLTPIKFIPGAATFESPDDAPTRYLLPLTPPSPKDATNITYAMIDVPPFTSELLQKINEFINGTISYILITNKNSVHYDDSASTVYVERRSDVYEWIEALQQQQQQSANGNNNITVVMHRTDVPRDMREGVTQALDGYGPWALQRETTDDNGDGQHPSFSFEETGTPVKILEWDDDLVREMLEESQRQGATTGEEKDAGDDDEAPSTTFKTTTTTTDRLRQKEDGKAILAVHTPGHTMGSVSYIFPSIKVCCSGFTIPEDNEAPRLDVGGFVTTNRAGCHRQAESARELVKQYVDRFDYVLPSRGEILELGDDVEARQERLEEIIDTFDKIGSIYDSLGITGGDDKKK